MAQRADGQRDKSLTPKLVETIINLEHLRSLEVSGHSRRYYEPQSLGALPKLEDLRVMMPDPNFRDGLLPLAKELDARPTGGLRGLGIIHLVSCSRAVAISVRLTSRARR